ncbi:MAG: hypothetical protein U9P72_00755 [Campylobacterota bacterium]|nr:hypothetical protein [Campylobacterota bacterium]
MTKLEIQESYGIRPQIDLWTICQEVCECLGNGVNNTADIFVHEIMGVETDHGTIRDLTVGRAGTGVCQFDEMPFYDRQSRYEEKHIKKILEHFDIDMSRCTWEELELSPLKSAIACRLYFKAYKEPIPADILNRAKQWKELYNTEDGDGDGTVEHYLEMNKNYDNKHNNE